MQHDETNPDTSPATETRSYASRSGYRMWGGDPRVRNEGGMAWFSLAIVIGAALAIGTWFAHGR